MKPDVHRAALAWLRKAESDLKAAAILLPAPGAPLKAVCFHAQQAAEKAVKGVLPVPGSPFPTTHDLALQCRLLPPDVQIAPSVEDQVELTYSAVSPRDPDDTVEVDPVLAERMNRVAETLYA